MLNVTVPSSLLEARSLLLVVLLAFMAAPQFFVMGRMPLPLIGLMTCRWLPIT